MEEKRNNNVSENALNVGGGQGAGDREKRRREVYGRWEKGGGKQDSQGGRKREKKGKIMQHCAVFCNKKNAKRQEPKNTGREPGLKGMGSGRFNPPSLPLELFCQVFK